MPNTLANHEFHYVALGDSLANGVGANGLGYPQQLLSLLQLHRITTLHLFAVNGQTSTQLLRKQNLYRESIKQANLITVNIGGNDLKLTWKLYGGQHTPRSIQRKRMQIALTTLSNNWNELAKLIVRNAPSNAKVVFINLYNPYQIKHPRTRAFVAEANRILETIGANYNFKVVDSRKLLNLASNKPGKSREMLMANDDLHLSAHGYEIIAQAVYRIVYPIAIWKKAMRLLKAPVKVVLRD